MVDSAMDSVIGSVMLSNGSEAMETDSEETSSPSAFAIIGSADKVKGKVAPTNAKVISPIAFFIRFSLFASFR